MQDIFEKIVADPRYQRNIEYGKPRRGHAEGKVKAHIAELENNLIRLFGAKADGLPHYQEEYWWKLRVLIHVHDSFKAESKRDVSIMDPQSHASLARAYLATLTDDEDMLNICQWHDLGYAVYRKFKGTGRIDEDRLYRVCNSIKDLNLFLLFAIIDACTESKGREMITWFVGWANHRFHESRDVRIGIEDILPGKELAAGAW